MAERTYDFQQIADGLAEPPASARLLGWSFVSIDQANARLTCSFQAIEAFLNPAGFVQGGLLAAMLDETMGPVAAAVTGEAIFAQTLEMKVSYLRAARLGLIFGEGRLLKRGRDILFLEGTLADEQGETLAVASATARALTSKPAPNR